MAATEAGNNTRREETTFSLEVAHELEFTLWAPMTVKWVLEIESLPEENVEHQLGGPWARLEDLRGV